MYFDPSSHQLKSADTLCRMPFKNSNKFKMMTVGPSPVKRLHQVKMSQTEERALTSQLSLDMSGMRMGKFK